MMSDKNDKHETHEHEEQEYQRGDSWEFFWGRRPESDVDEEMEEE